MKKITDDEILFLYQNMFEYQKTAGHVDWCLILILTLKIPPKKKFSLQNLEIHFQKQKGD